METDSLELTDQPESQTGEPQVPVRDHAPEYKVGPGKWFSGEKH